MKNVHKMTCLVIDENVILAQQEARRCLYPYSQSHHHSHRGHMVDGATIPFHHSLTALLLAHGRTAAAF